MTPCQYGVIVAAIVTDNASNMESMRDLVIPNVFTYGCQAHVLNLLAADLSAGLESVSTKIVAVLKAFRNVHALVAAQAERKMGKPPLPANTRWCSARDSYKYFDTNWGSLADIATKLLKTTDPIRRILEELPVRRAATDLVSYFDPVAFALNCAQRKGTSLGEIVDIWLELVECFPTNNKIMKAKVVERSKQALGCPFFLAANLLDHRRRGQKLNPDQVGKARNFINAEGPASASAMSAYLAKEHPFTPDLFEQAVSPTAWWRAGAMSGFPAELSQLGERLAACEASSATLERHFSTLGYVYGDLRTGLGVEKAGKLAAVYRFLNRK